MDIVSSAQHTTDFLQTREDVRKSFAHQIQFSLLILNAKDVVNIWEFQLTKQHVNLWIAQQEITS